MGPKGFERFSAFSKLEVLYLDGNYFNNYTLQSLSGIASLKELDLNNNNLNGAIHIKEFKAFTNLEDLYLSGTEINDLVTTVDPQQEAKDYVGVSSSFFLDNV
nr:hypothetical protein CFP56_35827 [Quercus suber]